MVMSDYFKGGDFEVAMRRRREYGVVRLIGSVNSESIFHVLDMMEHLAGEHYNEIVLELTSPGGELSPLQRFISSVENFRKRNIRLITQGYDSVASAAAVMLSAGDVRLAARNCDLLYHLSRLSDARSITAKHARYIESSLVELDEWVVGVLTHHTGWGQEFIRTELEHDYPTALATAESFNFIDKIGDYRDADDLHAARVRSQGDAWRVVSEVRDTVMDDDTLPEDRKDALRFAMGRLPKALGVRATGAWAQSEAADQTIREAIAAAVEDETTGSWAKALQALQDSMSGEKLDGRTGEDERGVRTQVTGAMEVHQFRDLIPETGAIPQEEVVRHFLALGETGSGKTKSMVEPILEGLLNFRPVFKDDQSGEKTSLFVVDPKNELYDFIRERVQEHNHNLTRIVIRDRDSAESEEDSTPLQVSFEAPQEIGTDARNLPTQSKHFETVATWVVHKAASLDPTNILNGDTRGAGGFAGEASREIKAMLESFAECLIWFRRYPDVTIKAWRSFEREEMKRSNTAPDAYFGELVNHAVKMKMYRFLDREHGTSTDSPGSTDSSNPRLTEAELADAVMRNVCKAYLSTQFDSYLELWDELWKDAPIRSDLHARIVGCPETCEEMEPPGSRTRETICTVLGWEELQLEKISRTCIDDETVECTMRIVCSESKRAAYEHEAKEWIGEFWEWWNGLDNEERTKRHEAIMRRQMSTRERLRHGTFGPGEEASEELKLEEIQRGVLSMLKVRDAVADRSMQNWVILCLFAHVWSLPRCVLREEIAEVGDGEGFWFETGSVGWETATEALLNGLPRSDVTTACILRAFERDDATKSTIDETQEAEKEAIESMRDGFRNEIKTQIDERLGEGLVSAGSPFEEWLKSPDRNVFHAILSFIYPLFSRSSDQSGGRSAAVPAVDRLLSHLEEIRKEIGREIDAGGIVEGMQDWRNLGKLSKKLERTKSGSLLDSYKGDAVSGSLVQAIQPFTRPPFSSVVFFGIDYRGNGGEKTKLEEVIDKSGEIVVLLPQGSSMTSSEEMVVRAAKARFFEGILASGNRGNLLRRSAEEGGARHFIAYVADEFQRFITVGDDHGEQSFIDRCRSYGVGCVFATQSLASLRYKLGEGRVAESSLNIVLANVGNKAFFRTTDIESIAYFDSLIRNEQVVSVRGLPSLEPGACWFVRPNGAMSRRKVRLDG